MGTTFPYFRAIVDNGLTSWSTGPLVRLAERAAAGAALVCAAPVLLSSAALIRGLSGQTPFVAHRRVGQHGREFWMLKLRTMWGSDGIADHGSFRLVEYVDGSSVPIHKCEPDPRVTSRFAAMLRKYSIDELPQLIHVAAGTMSVVGPRPLTRVELDAYYGRDGLEVISRRPGITGLWQVVGRNRLSYGQRRRLDLSFVRNRSMRLCIAILLRTPRKVLSGRNAF